MERDEIRWFDLENRCGRWTPEEQREVVEIVTAHRRNDETVDQTKDEIAKMEVQCDGWAEALDISRATVTELKEKIREMENAKAMGLKS